MTTAVGVQQRDLLATLFASFDAPFGATGTEAKAKLQSYAWAMEGFPVKTIEQAVRDFAAGKVERPPSKRGKLPTSEELGARLRTIAAEVGAAVERNGECFAPPAGPAWGAEVYRLLLAGPDADMRKPTAFIAKLIADGDTQAKRRHQAINGFGKVNGMFERAREAKGSMVNTRSRDMAELMEAVPVSSPVFERWKVEHEQRGWPWFPDMGKQRVVYLPKGGPEQLAAFEAKV